MKWFILIGLLLIAGCAGVAPQEVSADTIGTVDQTSSVVTNTGMDFKTLIIFALLAGWAIPSPMSMLTGMFKIFTFLKWW